MNSTVRHLSEHVDPKRQELVRSGKELKLDRQNFLLPM